MGSTPTTAPGLYTTVKGSRHATRLTAAKNRELNDHFIFAGDANLLHKPQFWVGIFNVSELEQRIERPWVHPKFTGLPTAQRRPMAKMIVVPACEPDQPYGKPFLIPDIVQMPEERPGSWNVRTFGQDGRFLAQDALNPDDPSGNWRTVRPIPEGFALNEGTNLYNYGCFWISAPTVDELIPSDEEIETAHARLEETYNRLVEQAKDLSLQGPEGIKQIGPLHRRAANYFGLVDVDWNRRYTRKIACPNCAEPLAPTAAVCHKCPAVINWTRAIALGLRTVKQAIEAGIIPEQAEAMGGPVPDPDTDPEPTTAKPQPAQGNKARTRKK